ncbi:MAG TPA: NUMOD3 domain-containing DNA-binding protein [Candidatus Paceibacterota bacterium]|nr:NUMOD3 domain-containing DNA-binding protein [Candidatus Paceibacterota bacterium]
MKRHIEKYISSSEYRSIHIWLDNNYGKPQECDSVNCNGKSQTYDWALIHGYDYDRNRNHYMRLCRSCHSRYDYKPRTFRNLSEEEKKKIGDFHRGKILSPETKSKISNTLKGRHLSEQTKQKMREKIICPHCGKNGGKSAMKRYHFDNCKYGQ